MTQHTKSLHVLHAQSSVDVLDGQLFMPALLQLATQGLRQLLFLVFPTWGSPWHCLSGRWGVGHMEVKVYKQLSLEMMTTPPSLQGQMGKGSWGGLVISAMFLELDT